MKIGQLVERSDGTMAGKLRTLKLALPGFLMRKIANPSQSPDAPTWELVVDGVLVVGLGWEKTITRGENEGQGFFSLTFDDPSFDRPLHVAAFRAADDPAGQVSYDIVWNRPRGGAAGGGAPGPVDDKIPY